MEVDSSRTFHASQALELSELIALRFARLSFGTATKRRLDVASPDGPSTDGGRKARQSLVLVPVQEGQGTKIVCGFIDAPRQTAEVRSYSVVSQQHRARYGADLDISRGEYERFVEELLAFLRGQQMDAKLNNRLTLATPQPRRVAPSRPSMSYRALFVGVVIGVAIGFAFARSW